MRAIKRKGLLVKPSVFRKKKGSYSEALNLSANINPSPNKYWVHIKRWSFIGENGVHSLRACIYSKRNIQ